jgi:hypothetical protein
LCSGSANDKCRFSVQYVGIRQSARPDLCYATLRISSER